MPPGSISSMQTCPSQPCPERRSGRSRKPGGGWAGPSPWVSSGEGDFNYDFGVSFTEADRARPGGAPYNYGLTAVRNSPDMFGVSIFVKDEAGEVFHSYSTYHRGTELLMGAFNWLDLTPKGRNEAGGVMDWVRLHDEY